MCEYINTRVTIESKEFGVEHVDKPINIDNIKILNLEKSKNKENWSNIKIQIKNEVAFSTHDSIQVAALETMTRVTMRLWGMFEMDECTSGCGRILIQWQTGARTGSDPGHGCSIRGQQGVGMGSERAGRLAPAIWKTTCEHESTGPRLSWNSKELYSAALYSCLIRYTVVSYE